MFECAVMFPSWLSEFWICYNAVEFPFSVFIFAVVFLNFLSCLWFRGHIFQICRHDSWIYGQVSESPVVFPCSQKYLPYLKGRGASGANSRNPGNNVRQLTVDGKSYTYQGTLRAHNAFCCSCGLLGFFFFLCCHASQCALVFLNSTISNMRSCFGFTVGCLSRLSFAVVFLNWSHFRICGHVCEFAASLYFLVLSSFANFLSRFRISGNGFWF